LDRRAWISAGGCQPALVESGADPLPTYLRILTIVAQHADAPTFERPALDFRIAKYPLYECNKKHAPAPGIFRAG
jgi:hypothetical protein